MRLLLSIITIFYTCLLSGQSTGQDSVLYQSSLEWLDTKLNYEYYDGEGEKWWKNTFYINEDGLVTIKHISSDKRNTAKMKEKTCIIRTFRLEDINPGSIKISSVEKSQGRIAKGQMLELRTFANKKSIQKTINNKKGSSTSFLNLSFPKTSNDSISNRAETVKEKLTQAINAKTRIHSFDNSKDFETIFSVLQGTFQSDDGTTWKSNLQMSKVLKIEHVNDNIKYLGYDTIQNECYFLEIGTDGMIRYDLTKRSDSTLSLLKDEEVFLDLNTINSFKYQGKVFFRQ
ncbi:MAG: hypothetical protein HRT61_19145 [Ekhidna sp.]|nr:hypothetical protein [Ekhidna sp.]